MDLAKRKQVAGGQNVMNCCQKCGRTDPRGSERGVIAWTIEAAARALASLGAILNVFHKVSVTLLHDA